MSLSLFCILFVFYVDDGVFEFLLKSERGRKVGHFYCGFVSYSLMNNCYPFLPACFFCFLQRTFSSLELPMDEERLRNHNQPIAERDSIVDDASRSHRLQMEVNDV